MEIKTEQELRKLIKPDKYQVFLFACRAQVPFNFAFHPWFVINEKGKLSRFEIRHYKNNQEWGHLFVNEQPVFQGLSVFLSLKKTRKTILIEYLEGEENSLAQQILELIKKSQKLYPYNHKYLLWGPNSNTYAQWVLNHFPEWKVKLSWGFIGKDYKKL